MTGQHAATRRRRAGTAQVFAVPAVLLLATVAGLLLGLTGDGLPDGLSWALLLVPVLAAAAAFARRS